MPACVDCAKFDPRGPSCLVPIGSPIRKCSIAFLEREFSKLHGKRVLEIGCGTWAWPRNLVLNTGNEWFGIEPNLSQSPPPRIDQRPEELLPSRGRVLQGTGCRLPFRDGSMDVVFATNTLEHVREWGEPFRGFFIEAWRILKDGGRLLLDFPIHLHGHAMFLDGEIPHILALWNASMWSELGIEEWRKDHQPLEPYYGWRRPGHTPPRVTTAPGPSSYVISVSAVKRLPPSGLNGSMSRYRAALAMENAMVGARRSAIQSRNLWERGIGSVRSRGLLGALRKLVQVLSGFNPRP